MTNQTITYTEQEVRQLRNSISDLANTRFEIPVSGPCETKHGEMLRAVSKILYRYFNDGDSMFTGYGCETCGPQAAFLKNEFNVFAEPIQKGLNKILKADSDEYVNLLGEIATHALTIIENEQDEPRGKQVYDYEQEWENNLCDACECYFPADQLTSNGMGSQYCSCCDDDFDEDQ